MAWYSDWSYRKAVTIDNTGNASILTNYQVRIEVEYDSHMLYDFDDIRFTNEDGETLLYHWREYYFEYSSAVFWVKIPNIPASSNKTIYMYYGKVGVSDVSDDVNTFITGADFNDGSTTGLTINTAASAVVEVPSIASKQIYGLKIDDWGKYAFNPVLPFRAGKWDSNSVRELAPITLDTTGKIVRDANSKIVAYHGGKNAAGTRQIGIAKSSDEGFSWGDRLDTPTIAPSGQEGSWYKSHVETPCVLKRNSDGLLMMMATGQEDPAGYTSRSFGVFSSENGTDWTDQGQVLTPDQFNFEAETPCTKMGVPSIIKRQSDGNYVLLFEGSAGGAWRIFGATATDFFGTWTPLNSGNPIFSETGSGWEQYTVANPRLIEIDENEFLLAYNGQQAAGTWRIGFAYSSDLLNWTRYSGNPVLGPKSGWEATDVETTFLVKDNSSHLRLFYQGFNASGQIQVGLALSQQARRLHAKSTAAADGWIIGKNLDGIDEFIFEFQNDIALNDASIAGNTHCGLVDFASVPSPMVNTSWNPQIRMMIGRYSPADANANKFYIQYMDTENGLHYWDGDSWETGKTYFDGVGLYKVKIWDDGTNYNIDIIDFMTDESILTSIAVIAKSSVKAFSDGRIAMISEPYTTHFYQGQYFDNFIIREFASTEPSTSLGEEEEPEGEEDISVHYGICGEQSWGW